MRRSGVRERRVYRCSTMMIDRSCSAREVAATVVVGGGVCDGPTGRARLESRRTHAKSRTVKAAARVMDFGTIVMVAGYDRNSLYGHYQRSDLYAFARFFLLAIFLSLYELDL